MENKHRMQETAEALFRAKQKRRRELSRLPFEEKMRILADLQKMAREVQRTAGGMRRRPSQFS